MERWNDFFRVQNYNGAPDWMYTGSDSVASQVIRYPPPQRPPERYRYYDRDASLVDPRVITMVLYAPICCEGCQEKLLSRLFAIDGVRSVDCDQTKQKVTVTGTAPRAEVLHACRKVFERSTWWSSLTSWLNGD